MAISLVFRPPVCYPLSLSLRLDQGVLDEALASKLFFGLISGLQYLHSKRICHRDIKVPASPSPTGPLMLMLISYPTDDRSPCGDSDSLITDTKQHVVKCLLVDSRRTCW